MGSVVNLEGKIYNCKHCRTHLALSENIISKENVDDKSQKYKEGKSVLERIKISGSDGSNYRSDADDT